MKMMSVPVVVRDGKKVCETERPNINLMAFVACQYYNFWWIWQVDVEKENAYGPYIYTSREHFCWLPLNNILIYLLNDCLNLLVFFLHTYFKTVAAGNLPRWHNAFWTMHRLDVYIYIYIYIYIYMYMCLVAMFSYANILFAKLLMVTCLNPKSYLKFHLHLIWSPFLLSHSFISVISSKS